ncbi:hypothetical protein E3N88_20973 [Mikania micrantha]|uniref:Uncharacterized protein n=1 Tax=Mikania micrantha TaxID=192012 RepID=A0A5N6NK70_9ASTR|nr:hypothetical protein E3N88_20973 [Mikania micrantha]
MIILIAAVRGATFWTIVARPYSAIVICYPSPNTLEAIFTLKEAPLKALKAWSSKEHHTSSLAAIRVDLSLFRAVPEAAQALFRGFKAL